MSAGRSRGPAADVNLKREIDPELQAAPAVDFEPRASLAIARWILMIFGVAYGLGYLAFFMLLMRDDATFADGANLVRDLIQLPLPLVTLAVGYYLGDRNRLPAPPARRR